jgi:hypothetical protein
LERTGKQHLIGEWSCQNDKIASWSSIDTRRMQIFRRLRKLNSSKLVRERYVADSGLLGPLQGDVIKKAIWEIDESSVME